MTRKAVATLIMIIIASLALPATSVRGEELADSFDSEENLALFDFNSNDGLNNSFLDDVMVSLVTQAPGAELYVWFGHAGLLIETPLQDVMYDWGVFSFSPGFYLDFIFGRLYYSALPTWPESVFGRAEREERTVTVLSLDIDNAAKSALIDFVNYNVTPPNNVYLYDYYFDNCATRIRDIVNSAEDDGFRQWAEGISTGYTLRQLSTLYMKRSSPVAFTLNVLQGPSIDNVANLYEACFLPDILMKALEAWYDKDGTVVYQGSEADVGNMHLAFSSLVAGLVVAIIMYTLSRSSKRAYGVVSFFIHLYFTFLSSILLFMMTCTNHTVTWGNENIVFFNPLFIIPLVQSATCIFRPKAGLGLTTKVYRILLVLMLSTLVMKGFFPTVFTQDNIFLFLFLSPVYLAMSLGNKEKKNV